MQNTRTGLREAALTLAYNAILIVRAAARQLTHPTVVGVRVLVEQNDELLLVRHRGGRHPWSLPGGGVDHRESLAEAALREVREEGGCEARLSHLLGVYHSFGEGMNNYTTVFVCTPLGQARAPVGDLEIVDARFFPRHDLPVTVEPGTIRRIAEHAAGQRGLHGPW